MLIRLVILLLFLGVSSSQAASSATPAPEISASELESLAKSLEDEKARTELVKQLRTLAALRKGEKPPGTVEASFITQIAEKVEQLGDQLEAAILALGDLPGLLRWIGNKASDPEEISRFFASSSELLLLLCLGLAAAWGSRELMNTPRKVLEKRAEGMIGWKRLPFNLAFVIISLVPALAFTISAYGMVTFFRLDYNTRWAAIMFINAFASAWGIHGLARGFLSPQSPVFRLPIFSEETAGYLYIWVRRLTDTGVFGYFAIEALYWLGLPVGGYHLLLKILGLTVTVMLVIFILQNRCNVGTLIRKIGGEALGEGSRLAALRNQAADFWHLLAVLYVVAIYLIWALKIKGGFEFVIRASVLTVIFSTAAWFISSNLKKIINRAFAVSKELKDKMPQLETRANRYLPVLNTVLQTLIMLIGGLSLLQVWGVETLSWLTTPGGRKVVGSAVNIAIVLVVATIVWEVVSSLIERFLTPPGGNNQVQRSARMRTLLPLLRKVFMIILSAFSGLIILAELGVNIAPLLAGAGVLGIAVGLGSQKLVQDLMTGMFMIFEDLMTVGDTVKVGENIGTVELISIRTIKLRDANGHVHTIPFSAIGTVVNMTRDFAYAILDVGISYDSDMEKAMGIIKEIGAKLQENPELSALIVEPIEVLGVETLGDSAVTIRSRIKTMAGKHNQIRREFNLKIKQAFDREGIEIPFPQMAIWKKG